MTATENVNKYRISSNFESSGILGIFTKIEVSSGAYGTIQGKNQYNAFNYNIPGDISSAAFFLVLTALNKNSKLLIKNVNINNNGTRINLVQRTDEFINDYWSVSASTGTPEYYARRDNTTILIAPTPVSTVDGIVAHVSRPTALTTATPNNYFTDFCYNALYNASMVEALLFMKNYEAIAVYESRYKEDVLALRNQARRTRRDDMESPASPAGGDNTILQGNL